MIKPGVLSFTKVCDLIKVCGDVGVRELKFGDLHIIFGPTEIGRTASGTPVPELPAEQIEKDALLKDDILQQEDDISELLLTDPVEHERLISLGELDQDENSRT